MPHSSASGRAASLARFRDPSDPERQSAEADLAAIKIENYVKKIVDSAPPLSGTQRAKLASLILSSDRAVDK